MFERWFQLRKVTGLFVFTYPGGGETLNPKRRRSSYETPRPAKL